ncbi:hypothetical protein BSKO_03108 [Bryopsis sp. KO-2023]|nr:hypothetical protein BSKO_03108 [Bryopsis sp. KO-2023]
MEPAEVAGPPDGETIDAPSPNRSRGGFLARLSTMWDMHGPSHSVKIRKEFRLRPKLFACVGGDFSITKNTLVPHWSFTYRFDEKISLELVRTQLRLQRKMSAKLGGATLDYSPRIGVRLDNGLKTNVDVRLNDLRPLKVALSCLCVGVLIGIPVKTTKAIPVRGLAKPRDREDISQLDCEVGVGVQREGSTFNLFCSEVNAVIRLGPHSKDL